ncbi:MAG: GGDEF domain-containing protein, partial [Acholeplasmatales bacterium]|nr:GGDEF domain-containing protein [Acholeplasmatales bacterium]
VAENDSLTGLPNRYCYNEYLKDASLDKKSVCVFLLDINNLKYINDKFGHAQGDELIKNASICIKDCFLDETGKNCFRIGGDEFVAILYDVKESEIEELLNKFNKLQKEKDVSIALGYAYSSDIKSIGYERLIMQADDNMYKDKQNYKKLSV